MRWFLNSVLSTGLSFIVSPTVIGQQIKRKSIRRSWRADTCEERRDKPQAIGRRCIWTIVLCLAVMIPARLSLAGGGPFKNDVTALALINDEIAFIATLGAIFKTTDGGHHWLSANQGLPQGLLSALLFIDEKTGYVGTGKGVFKTINGGQNWVAAHDDATNAQVIALAFADASRGYVSVLDKGLFKTNDGGHHWHPVNGGLPADRHVETIAVIDSDIAYIGVRHRGVFKTTDGGQHWTPAGSSLNDCIVSHLVFVDASNGYANCFGEALFSTSDGGQHWSEASRSLHRDSGIEGLSFVDIDHGYATTSRGLFKTKDGGRSWTDIAAPLMYRYSNRRQSIEQLRRALGLTADELVDGRPPLIFGTVGFLDADIGYVATESARLFKTVDGGQNWSAVNGSLAMNSITALAFADAVTGYAATNGGGVFKTSDSAQQWTAVNQALFDTEVNALAFLDADTGYAGTARGGVFKTTDGARHWVSVSDGLPATAITSLSFVDTANGYAGTEGRGVFKTSDGGASWHTANGDLNEIAQLEEYAYTYGYIKALRFIGVNHGIAITAGGYLFTADGGLHWTGASADSLQAVSYSDAETAYVGLEYRGVFKTTDAGQNWVAVNNGLGSKQIFALSFISADKGYVGTASGLFKTTDGGLNWRPASNGLPRRMTVKLLAFIDSDIGFASHGEKGQIFKTTDGGQHWIAVHGG